MPIEAIDYGENIRSRGSVRYLLGLIVRLQKYLKHERARRVARRRGAKIGENVVLPFSLARKANSNLVIGDETTIASDDLDLRELLRIGSRVIIGRNVKLTTQSHNIDSPFWETTGNGGLEIGDYVWCATDVSVLPGCRKIGRGAILGASAVVVKDVEEMAVMGGNPARLLRMRKAIHSSLVVPSVSGGDLLDYIKARKSA